MKFSPHVSLSWGQGYRFKGPTCKSRAGGSHRVLLTAAVMALGDLPRRKTIGALTCHLRHTGGLGCARLWSTWRGRGRVIEWRGGEEVMVRCPSLVELIPFRGRWTRRRRPFFLLYVTDTYSILIQVTKSGRTHSARCDIGVIMKILCVHTNVIFWHSTVSKGWKKMLLSAATCHVATLTHEVRNSSTLSCFGVSPTPWVVPVE